MAIKENYKGRYLHSITNSKGQKQNVFVVEGIDGYHAYYSKTRRSIPGKSRTAEGLARKLARSGHKKVTILD